MRASRHGTLQRLYLPSWLLQLTAPLRCACAGDANVIEKTPISPAITALKIPLVKRIYPTPDNDGFRGSARPLRCTHPGLPHPATSNAKNQSLPLVLLAGAGAGAGEGAGEAGAGAGTFAAGVSVAGLASPWLAESTRLRFLSPSFLKSVSYQPLPARRKEGALTRRCSSGSPQLGQIVGSSSDSFCRRSKR
jgi:hypothetical protein